MASRPTRRGRTGRLPGDRSVPTAVGTGNPRCDVPPCPWRGGQSIPWGGSMDPHRSKVSRVCLRARISRICSEIIEISRLGLYHAHVTAHPGTHAPTTQSMRHDAIHASRQTVPLKHESHKRPYRRRARRRGRSAYFIRDDLRPLSSSLTRDTRRVRRSRRCSAEWPEIISPISRICLGSNISP